MTKVMMELHCDEVKKGMGKAVERALNAVGLEAEGDAKVELENTPRRIDTGRLRNSITHRVRKEDGEKVVYIGTNVKYALWVHEGTGIHAAEGGGRKTPWAYKGKDGKTHFTHGMKPNRFLRNAIEKNREKYKSIIERELNKD
jgi:HK97 gp10 family phage protein